MHSCGLPTPSVFLRDFDVAVIGAGLAGLAAARTLAARGRSVLLVEPSGDLLWEATRALENGTQTLTSSAPLWTAWLAALRGRSGADDLRFDPALAEILTAHELSEGKTGVSVLLYAMPVATRVEAGEVTGVTLATKGGHRLIKARRWIDATETGLLARQVRPAPIARVPTSVHRSLVLQTLTPGPLDAVLPALAGHHPRLEVFRSSNLREGERRLRWHVGDGTPAWHRKVPALLRDLRALLAAHHPDADLLVSHCAMNDYPVYAETRSIEKTLPHNLFVASPALRGEPLVHPGDRFMLGASVASVVLENDAARVAARRPLPEIAPAAPVVTIPSDAEVVVAGAGTAGAVAAIAAGRAGARTLVFDHTTYPGGVGTGGGICGYFHGAKGGLQTEIDRRTQEMTVLLAGTSAGSDGWHHEAKKLVLLDCFEEAGVTFLGGALLAGVERDPAGTVSAVIVAVDGRLSRIPARAFIDGTGDGDLAALAGAGFALGRPGDARTLSYSQSIFSLLTREQHTDVRSCNFDAGWVDPFDPEDLSHARLAGIGQHLQPVWTHPGSPVAVSPLLGLRQSRQIDTDVRVTLVDLIGQARFSDSLGNVETVADTHSVDYEFESDEMAFYYWTCRGFRHRLRCELPYRMLLPRGLANVWIPSRAAGIDVEAAYGLRMQREMQRLGEVSGLAAAQAATHRTHARGIDLAALQSALDRSGARGVDQPEKPAPTLDAQLAALDTGLPGVHLWHLARLPESARQAVRTRFASAEPRVSFYAATLLAMWGESAAEQRLLRALESQETGPAPEERPVPGAFAQCIDIPFWLQAVLLLRRVGSARCLPALLALATRPGLPFNVRTTLALTLERLAARLGSHPQLVAALDALLAEEISDSVLPPSRSLWRTLAREPQKKLGNDRGAPVAQDHAWQLHLVVARIRQTLGLPARAEVEVFMRDPRGFVRRAFATALK